MAAIGLAQLLRERGFSVELTPPEEFDPARLADREPDLVVASYLEPSRSMIEQRPGDNLKHLDAPVVAFIPPGSEQIGQKALRTGADGYFCVDQSEKTIVSTCRELLSRDP